MLKFIILASCAIVMLVARLFMRILHDAPAISSRLFYVCWGLLVIGILLVGFNSDKLTRLDARKQWPTASGHVAESEVHGKDAIRPLVIYTYAVGDTVFTDSSTLQAPGFGNGRKEYEVAKDLSGEHPTGSGVKVYYNPKDPRKSTLTPDPPWDVYGKIGFGATLFMLGMFGVLLPRKRSTSGA